MTRRCGCGIWRAGNACACSRGTAKCHERERDAGRAAGGVGELTGRCGCGIWRRAMPAHARRAQRWVTSVSVDGGRAAGGVGELGQDVAGVGSGERAMPALARRTQQALVMSVSVTPDGRRAVSGSNDKTLRVWDLESGQCLRTLERHSEGSGGERDAGRAAGRVGKSGRDVAGVGSGERAMPAHA